MREKGQPVVVIKHIYKEDKSDVGRIGDFGIDGLWNETNAYSQLDDYMQCCLEHAAIVEAIAHRDLRAAKKAIKQNIRSK